MNTLNRRGFAMPVAIIGLVLLGLLATSGFYTARQEFKAGIWNERAQQAFYLAEEGATGVLANWDNSVWGSVQPWQSRTFVDTTALGVTTVQVTKGASRIFYLDSTSELTIGGPVDGGASRRVGILARVSSALFEPEGALLTRGQVNIKGNAEVHGEDLSPSHWSGLCGPTTDLPGIVMDDMSNFAQTGQGEITGTPPVVEDPTLSDDDFTQFGDFSWDELVALATKTYVGGNFGSILPSTSADGTCNSGSTSNWGEPNDPSHACSGYFPIIHVAGDAQMQGGGRGQGILLVDGDLDLRGGFEFYGVVIVQGAFETEGSGNRVNGAIWASNAEIQDQSIVGGSVTQYSSCAVEQAILNNASLNRARPIEERGWIDLSKVLN
jgi:hypothetical protein